MGSVSDQFTLDRARKGPLTSRWLAPARQLRSTRTLGALQLFRSCLFTKTEACALSSLPSSCSARMQDLEDEAARPTSAAAAVQQGAGSHPRGLRPAVATTSTTVSPAVPVYTPYQLPPLLHTAATASVNAGGQYSATTPSPASAFPLDPRFQPPAFSTTLKPGLPQLGAAAGDLPVQHSNRGLDALMNLHGMGSRDLTGSSGGSGADNSIAPADSLNSGAELPPKVVQKADRSCKKYVRDRLPVNSSSLAPNGLRHRELSLVPVLRVPGAESEECDAGEKCVWLSLRECASCGSLIPNSSTSFRPARGARNAETRARMAKEYMCASICDS
jgi:hypothetical protein